jgi:peptidyl-tRNA hydrolase, PTH1 family
VAAPLSEKWVVAGLGNPGPSYAQTRHNVGARAVQGLADRWGVLLRVRDGLLWGAAEKEDGTTAFLALPQTYMNASGEVLAPFLKYRNVPPERLIVVVDDMDLPPGRLRVRIGGSSGGHHGLDSIIAHLGTDRFTRVRLGVGKPPTSEDGAAWVLSGFAPGEREAVEEAVRRAADCVETYLDQGADAAMRTANPSPPDRGNP